MRTQALKIMSDSNYFTAVSLQLPKRNEILQGSQNSVTVTFTGENNFSYNLPSHTKILVQLYAH